jgi:hypothetical protein
VYEVSVDILVIHAYLCVANEVYCGKKEGKFPLAKILFVPAT